MGRFGHRFELLVVDEVHHFGCDLRARRSRCRSPRPGSAGLGLTATPQASRLTRRRGSPSTPDPHGRATGCRASAQSVVAGV